MATPQALVIPAHLKRLVRTQKFGYGDWEVVTYVVQATRNGKAARVSDDETYRTYPELVGLVPRGCSDVYKAGELVTTIRGMPKFTGIAHGHEDAESGEEEDAGGAADGVGGQQQPAALLAYDRVTAYFPEKVNGKAIVFTLALVKGEFWMVGGSKNRHVPAPLAGSVEGAELHHDILRSVQEHLQRLEPGALHALVGQTVLGEYMDNQHIVYGKVHSIFFNAPCLPAPRHVLPPQQGKASEEDVQAIMNMPGIEGVVIEYRSMDTGLVQTRFKVKTKWYTVLRAWREAIKNAGFSEAALVAVMKKRSDAFLKLSDAEIRAWEREAHAFVQWLDSSAYTPKDVSPAGVGMAVIWHQFKTGGTGGAQTRVELDCLSEAALSGVRLAVVRDTPAPLLEALGVLVVASAADVPASSVCVAVSSFKQTPSHYGIFLGSDAVKSVHQLAAAAGVAITQTKPLHITVKYVGSVKDKSAPQPERMGKRVHFSVVGVSQHAAGACLVIDGMDLPGNHVTLATAPGFKPAEVGTGVTPGNTQLLSSPVHMSGVYLPHYSTLTTAEAAAADAAADGLTVAGTTVVVAMMGTVGSGKSTLTSVLMTECTKRGVPGFRISTDKHMQAEGGTCATPAEAFGLAKRDMARAVQTPGAVIVLDVCGSGDKPLAAAFGQSLKGARVVACYPNRPAQFVDSAQEKLYHAWTLRNVLRRDSGYNLCPANTSVAGCAQVHASKSGLKAKLTLKTDVEGALRDVEAAGADAWQQFLDAEMPLKGQAEALFRRVF